MKWTAGKKQKTHKIFNGHHHLASLIAQYFFVLLTLSIPHICGFLIPLPPWRGLQQLLHIGPWGVALDQFLSCTSSPQVLYINENQCQETICLRELPEQRAGTTRIVFISDTHGKHRCLRIPDGDILVHCGDILLSYGYLGIFGAGNAGLNDFDDWLNSLPHEKKIVVGGNHDQILAKNATDVQWPRSATLLQNEGVQIKGLLFWASPFSPGSTINNAFQDDANKRCVENALQNETIDILITHAQCKEFTLAASRARVWAFGHFHDQYGAWQDKGCLFVNAASCDMIYRPINPPVVVDLRP